MNLNYHKKQQGFTLLEMLISITVFVMVTVIALGIYSSVIRANKKSVSLTKLHRDSQLIMSSIAKKIRQSQVDYTYYPSGEVPSDNKELALVDVDGTEYVFSHNSSDNTIEVSIDGGAAVDIPGGDVLVTDLKFYITPTTDPFTVVPSQTPIFPRVTMVLRLEPKDAEGMFSTYLVTQQTVPQRGGGY